MKIFHTSLLTPAMCVTSANALIYQILLPSSLEDGMTLAEFRVCQLLGGLPICSSWFKVNSPKISVEWVEESNNSHVTGKA